MVNHNQTNFQTTLWETKRIPRRDIVWHSRYVKFMRFILPGLALGLFLSYAVFASPQRIDTAFEKQFANLDVATNDLRMESPSFKGRDSEGDPYEIVAGAAIQDPDDPDFITLDSPYAIKAKDAEEQLQVTANSGIYSTLDRTIDLTDNVELLKGIIGDEYILNTDQAIVSLDDSVVRSTVQVTGRGENGTITAKGMTAYEDEGRVIFHDAHMRIEKLPVNDDTAEDQVEKAAENAKGSN
ncbi:MAG: LPS export ABC transporter periplasmic protein LptC [bacterium]